MELARTTHIPSKGCSPGPSPSSPPAVDSVLKLIPDVLITDQRFTGDMTGWPSWPRLVPVICPIL
jgi:hypothetical protein